MVRVGIIGFRSQAVAAAVAIFGLFVAYVPDGIPAASSAQLERPGLPTIAAPEATAVEPVGVLLYVSPAGNDNWSGRLPEPNAAKTDGPLATLHRVRDELRKLKARGELRNGATVLIRGGTYCLEQPFRLGKEDSGTEAGPIIYRAYGQEKPVLVGGRAISNFVPHKGSILKADITAAGFPKGAQFRQLFFDGMRQHLARYPNFDPDNPYAGGFAYADGKPVPMYQDIPNESRREFFYKGQDARWWANPQEVEVFVFPRYNWWNNIVPIASIDRNTRKVTLAGDCSYPIRPGDRYYVQNALEELDSPGEWYLDRSSGTLYFWPPRPLAGTPVYAPTMRTVIELGPQAEHIRLFGLTIECCDGDAVVLRDCRQCLVAGCTIRNVGDYNGNAVVVDGGRGNGVFGNDIYEVGRSGVVVSGGDRVTLTPAENYADNNYIHHVGVYYKQGVGIVLSGCGNRAAHNLIHDGPRMGIIFTGNNLLIEYNRIRHVNLETADTGAVYTGGRDWISSRGTVIRYNYFHDIIGFGNEGGHWVSPHYCWGVYLDDNAGGVDVIGNIVARCIRGLVHLHNGRDCVIENNVLVDGTLQQVEYNGWTQAHRYWSTHLPTMIRGYESVISQPVWKAMRGMNVHPKDAVLPDGRIMAGNVLRRNIIYYRDEKAKLFRFNNLSLAHYQSDYNLIWHFGRPLLLEVNRDIRPDTPEGWTAWQQLGFDRHSLVADPLFVAPDKDDYRLRPESPALKLGFQPIPVEKIGPYAHRLRASWPIVEAVGAREKPARIEHGKQ